jgi:hypothetical protein
LRRWGWWAQLADIGLRGGIWPIRLVANICYWGRINAPKCRKCAPKITNYHTCLHIALQSCALEILYQPSPAGRHFPAHLAERRAEKLKATSRPPKAQEWRTQRMPIGKYLLIGIRHMRWRRRKTLPERCCILGTYLSRGNTGATVSSCLLL